MQVEKKNKIAFGWLVAAALVIGLLGGILGGSIVGLWQNDSPASLEGWYTGRAMAGINTTPEDCIPMVEAVTKKDVQDIASLITVDTIHFLKAEEEE